jgi:uncharacterized protein YukE
MGVRNPNTETHGQVEEMRAFQVDTDLMVSAVGNIQSGADRLGDAKEMLDGLRGRIEAAGLGNDGDANDKLGGFRDRWNDEFGIISDMLSKFKDALNNGSETYNTADQEIARSMTPGSTPPAAEV